MSTTSPQITPERQAPSSSVQIKLDDILVSDRLRELRPGVVDELAESFATVGQLQPIVVRKIAEPHKCPADYVLIAGVHRLEAARKLEWKTIAAVVINGIGAELAEIDENLVRADLSAAERKAHIGRRKELYEAKHPETKHGAVGRGGKSSNSEISFVDDTAAKTGRGRSTVARDAKHATRVVVLDEIPGTSLDSDSEIEALSKLPARDQRDLAEQAKAGTEVTAKPARLPDRTIPPAPAGDDAQGTDTNAMVPFADRIWATCNAAWELLHNEPDNWPELSAAARKRRDKALDEFNRAWIELHDIAKKAVPKAGASKKKIPTPPVSTPDDNASDAWRAATLAAEAKQSAPVDRATKAAAQRAEADQIMAKAAREVGDTDLTEVYLDGDIHHALVSRRDDEGFPDLPPCLDRKLH